MSWTLNDIYHIWKRQVRAMGREMAPSAVRCLCMIARSSTAHPIMPGYSSQKCFRSNRHPNGLGFNSLPMKKS